MNRLVHLFARAVALEAKYTEPVVEIGAYQVPGQEEIADLRPHFKAKNYIGTDMRAGPGVDRVEDVHHLTFENGSIGTLLMLETMEHVADPARAMSEVRRVLAPHGMLVMTTPFALHIHNYPSDYWRFTPEAYHLLLKDFSNRLVGAVGPEHDPLFVLSVAFGASVPTDDAAAQGKSIVARYRQLIREDAPTARDHRLANMRRALTAALPMKEARRVYRQRAHDRDTHFVFVSGDARTAL